MTWLPQGFVHPARFILMTGHHLRPIRGTDVFLDFPAVMGSQANLWSLFGVRWGWPSPTMTIGQNLDDLVRHEREMEAQKSYNYCILDEEESQLWGCVYLDPPDAASLPAVDADVCWWVVDSARGSELETCLESDIPQWLQLAWPFRNPRLGPWWQQRD